jgi:uroporphyrinogen decarboxylase
MTSRERILAAINHREPDKVPVDLGATPSSGISAIAYNKLKKKIGIGSEPTRVYDVIQQLAQPEDAILEYFGSDAIDIGRVFSSESTDWLDTKLPDDSDAQYPSWFKPVMGSDGSWFAQNKLGKNIARMPNGSTFFDQLSFPYLNGFPQNYKDLDEAMDEVMWAAFPISPWDRSGTEDFWPMLREKTVALREKSDKALIVGVGCNLFEWGSFLRRMDQFLMDLIMDPDNVEKLLDALMEKHMSTLEKVCHWVGDIVDMIKFGDDLGMGQGPLMSPNTYKSLFKPRHSKLCDYVRKNSSMHTYLHSCGSIYQLIPDLIDAGFEIINPVQTNTADMEPERLKKEFGKEITFWGGGIETASVLNNGTTEDVRKQVLKRLEIFSPGGGYVFNTIHNILPDVPPENVVAMFDAVREFNGKGK